MDILAKSFLVALYFIGIIPQHIASIVQKNARLCGNANIGFGTLRCINVTFVVAFSIKERITLLSVDLNFMVVRMIAKHAHLVDISHTMRFKRMNTASPATHAPVDTHAIQLTYNPVKWESLLQ